MDPSNGSGRRLAALGGSSSSSLCLAVLRPAGTAMRGTDTTLGHSGEQENYKQSQTLSSHPISSRDFFPEREVELLAVLEGPPRGPLWCIQPKLGGALRFCQREANSALRRTGSDNLAWVLVLLTDELSCMDEINPGPLWELLENNDVLWPRRNWSVREKEGCTLQSERPGCCRLGWAASLITMSTKFLRTQQTRPWPRKPSSATLTSSQCLHSEQPLRSMPARDDLTPMESEATANRSSQAPSPRAGPGRISLLLCTFMSQSFQSQGHQNRFKSIWCPKWHANSLVKGHSVIFSLLKSNNGSLLEKFVLGRDSSLPSLLFEQFECVSVFQEVTNHFCMKNEVKGAITLMKFIFKFWVCGRDLQWVKTNCTKNSVCAYLYAFIKRAIKSYLLIFQASSPQDSLCSNQVHPASSWLRGGV